MEVDILLFTFCNLLKIIVAGFECKKPGSGICVVQYHFFHLNLGVLIWKEPILLHLFSYVSPSCRYPVSQINLSSVIVPAQSTGYSYADLQIVYNIQLFCVFHSELSEDPNFLAVFLKLFFLLLEY